MRRTLRAWWALANRAKAERQAETSSRLMAEYKQFRRDESEREAAANAPLPRLPVSSIQDILSTRVPCLVLASTSRATDAHREYDRLEARLALFTLRQPLPLHVRLHRIEYIPSLKQQLTTLGLAKMPTAIVTWKGQSLKVWAQQNAAIWRVVSDDITDALNCCFQKDTDEALENLFQAMRRVLEIETAAVRRLQRGWRERRGRLGVSKWKHATTVALRRKRAEEQAWHWRSSCWNEYSRQGDRSFWFNHRTGDSRWERPAEQEVPKMDIYIIASTGYRKLLRMRKRCFVGDLKQELVNALRVPAEHLRLCIRPEGIDHTGQVITGVNNRRLLARLGRGMPVEVRDGTEWVRGKVVRVYEDQSVDVEAFDSGSLFKCTREDVRLVEQTEESVALVSVAEEGAVVEALVIWQDEPVPESEEDHCIHCTKCASQPARWYCQECNTVLCEPCFLLQHELADKDLDDAKKRWKAGHRAIPVDVRGIAQALLQHGYMAELYGFCISCSVREVAASKDRCHCCLGTKVLPSSNTDTQSNLHPQTGMTLQAVLERWSTRHWRRVKAEQAALQEQKEAAEKEATRQFLTEAFNRHDADGNGTMDKSELRKCPSTSLCSNV